MWKPKDKEDYYKKKADLVVETFKRTGGDFKKTAQMHRFNSVRSVYRYLSYAGYVLPEQGRGADGKFLPRKKIKMNNIEKKIEEMRDDSKAQMIIKYAGTDSYSIREVLQNVDTHIDQLLQEKPTMTEAVELSKDKDYETKRLIREFYDEGYADAKEELSQLLQESGEVEYERGVAHGKLQEALLQEEPIPETYISDTTEYPTNKEAKE